jgi:hypothetical protein
MSCGNCSDEEDWPVMWLKERSGVIGEGSQVR